VSGTGYLLMPGSWCNNFGGLLTAELM